MRTNHPLSCRLVRTPLPSSLKNHGADEEVEGMFEMGQETVALPLEEKLPFEQGDEGVSFGYVLHPRLAISPRDTDRIHQLQGCRSAVHR